MFKLASARRASFLIVCLLAFRALADLPVELKDFKFRTGQIIGVSQMIYEPFSIFYEVATASRIGHVGLVLVEGDDVSIVQSDFKLGGEVNGFMRQTLDEFFQRSWSFRGQRSYVIIEPETTLNNYQSQRLFTAIEELETKKFVYNKVHLYDPNMKMMNCSEFVHNAFKLAGLQPPGELEKIGETMNVKGFHGVLLAMYRLAFRAAAPDPEANAISPISVVKSPHFRLLRNTIRIDHTFSDKDLYEDWHNYGGIEALGIFRHTRAVEVFDPVAAFRKVIAESTNEFATTLKQEVKGLRDKLTAKPLSETPFREFPSHWRRDPATIDTVISPFGILSKCSAFFSEIAISRQKMRDEESSVFAQ